MTEDNLLAELTELGYVLSKLGLNEDHRRRVLRLYAQPGPGRWGYAADIPLTPDGLTLWEALQKADGGHTPTLRPKDDEFSDGEWVWYPSREAIEKALRYAGTYGEESG